MDDSILKAIMMDIFMKGGDYDTKLSKDEESKYSEWKSKLPKNLQYEGDYDLRGLFKENPKAEPSENLHFTDKYKKPNHRTFSNQSVYFNPDTKRFAGEWKEDGKKSIWTPYDPTTKSVFIEDENGMPIEE